MNALREEYRLTLASCALVLGASVAFAAVERETLGATVMAVDLAHALVALAGIAVLWQRRDRLGSTLCQVIFGVVALSFIPNDWVTELIAAQRGLLRDPLTSSGYVILGIALLAPGRPGFGASLIGISLASALGLWWVLVSQHPAIRGAGGEPWTTFLFSGIALVYLALRGRRQEAQRKLARAQAERDALARVARLFLAVRDSTNSPLQTLSFATEILNRRHPQSNDVLDRMTHSIERLKGLTALLAASEAWHGPPLDATTDLAREVDAANRALREAFEAPHAP